MFAPLLLLQAQDAGAIFSSALKALFDTCETLAPAEFVRRIATLALQGGAPASKRAGEAGNFDGIGWPRDPARACARFERAAPQRGDSAHDLARCFENGQGRPHGLASARTLHAGAARRGAHAQTDHAGSRTDAAARIQRAGFRGAAPDGKTATDREAAAEMMHWRRIAAAEEPDPKQRKEMADILTGIGKN